MWTKTNKSVEPSLFVDPSTGAGHLEVGGYFKYHHLATRLSEVPSAASTSSSTGSCVSWKANSARRKRFGEC
ncbi:unnamed protein product [Anisakis simplex]|uniref:Site-specific DNA-methyltransferase (adenine-specific) n=1 Tax=Anisakis simplex TaxID=6269 RepID=A0A0M3K2A1_ANISI|nr:unnamed protein product [Anisakis simplex]